MKYKFTKADLENVRTALAFCKSPAAHTRSCPIKRLYKCQAEIPAFLKSVWKKRYCV